MALVTKNDVTQIFAIQAPEVDLPPTFANYPRGWDVARANNGKPTIKQFNYIQQRTDQNVLWIHQNGAALPYDAAMEYAEDAIVVKDGVLQQWDGGAWVKIVENASTTQSGITKLVNDLTTGGADAALTAEQGKLFFNMFSGGDKHFKIPNPLKPDKPWIVQSDVYIFPGSAIEHYAEITLPISYTTVVFPFAVHDNPLSGSSMGVNGVSATLSKIKIGSRMVDGQPSSAGSRWFTMGY